MLDSRTVDLRVPFVGRTSELHRLVSLLKQGRFVTLVGPGGVGKSRLAFEAASRQTADGAPRAIFVSLAGIAPEAAVGTVMHALSLREEPKRQALETLHDALLTAPTLLVLDNCEHAPDETSALIESLTGIPQLTVLATSQCQLDYPAEIVFTVEPFTQEEAVRFFIERAHLERSALTNGAEDALDAIVRALDGLPVALDLAAARLASLTLDELASELRQLRPYHLRSTRGSDPRHRTIGNVIAWSHSRLSDTAKRAFALASLFTDEFNADDIAKIGNDDRDAIASALEDCASLSLMMRTEFAYRMLLPIRAVATRAFASQPQRNTIEERFATRMNDVARALWEEMRGENAGSATYRLFLRYGDFSNTVGWALKRPADRLGLISDILTVLTAVWADGGRFSEGLAWCERLQSVAERLKPNVRGTVYYVGLCVAHAAGEYTKMLEQAPKTISAFTIASDRLGLARSYNALAAAACNTGVLDDAWRYAETALHVYEQLAHRRGVAVALINMGNVLFEGRNEAARARPLFRRALEILETDGTDTLRGIALGNLAEVDYTIREYDGSRDYARDAISRFEAAASLAHIAWQHETLARVSIALGHAPAAHEHLHLACDLLGRAPHPGWIARLGEIAARLLIFVGQHEEAALALAGATRLRRERSIVAMGFIARERDEDERRMIEVLGERAIGDAQSRVAAWDLRELPAFFAALLVGIGRSEAWRRPAIVSEPQPQS